MKLLTKQNKHKTKVLKRRDKSGHNKTHINKSGKEPRKTKIKLNLKNWILVLLKTPRVNTG